MKTEVPEKDRTKDYSKKHPALTIKIVDPVHATMALAKINAMLADMETDVVGAGLVPGMAGYGSGKTPNAGYALFSPGPVAPGLAY